MHRPLGTPSRLHELSLSPTAPIAFDSPKVPTNFQLPECILAGLLIDTFSTDQNSCTQVTEAHGMAPPWAGTAWGGESTGL